MDRGYDSGRNSREAKAKAESAARREIERNARRDVGRAQRDTNKVYAELQREEQKLMTEIKVLGRKGDVDGARALAGSLVNVRKKQAQIKHQQAQYASIPTQVKIMNTQAAMTSTMEKTANVMASAAKQNDPKKMMQNVQNYQRETEKMNLVQEMMDDAFDSAADVGEEESDDVVNQVFEELRIEKKVGMKSAPTHNVVKTQNKETVDEDDIDALIASLK